MGMVMFLTEHPGTTLVPSVVPKVNKASKASQARKGIPVMSAHKVFKDLKVQKEILAS
jgi:hypothetical protein